MDESCLARPVLTLNFTGAPSSSFLSTISVLGTTHLHLLPHLDVRHPPHG